MKFHSANQWGSGDFATFYEALPIMTREKVDAVASLLDIQPLTVRKYLKGESTPPKAYTRLLFMESHYGLSAVATHAANGLAIERTLNRSLSSEIDKLRAQVNALEIENAELKQHDSSAAQIAANSPRWIA